MFLGITLIIYQAMSPIFASALVPGLGEIIQGEKTKGRTFLIAEGSIWLTYLGFNYFGHKMDHSARVFAIDHSGANPTRKDDEYFDALEDYMSSEDYNLEIERDASYFYPNDPQRQQEYIQENGYFGNDAWEWDTLSNKNTYWERRKSARENLRRASFMPGFAIINRVISIIDVVIFTKEERFGLDTRPGKIGIYYKF
ncbi:MAG TPA: hypothetical protein ENI34_03940 [candidate division WOR-3 bacterium]|uniref:DUF5683 domain-containing protein n=1 Tax=candidate division WOR-3 bacterium TaxID=2052148 RepID=A0A9C9ELD4_UNCW3|nr:hypothetical protein [candidate division WOR-3 bacterium]